MSVLLNRFWNEEDGAIISSELILVMTVLILGMIVGLSALRDSIVGELADVAAAFGSINQSYQFFGLSGHSAEVVGSFYLDDTDFCEDGSVDDEGEFENCIGIIFGGGNDPSEESDGAGATFVIGNPT